MKNLFVLLLVFICFTAFAQSETNEEPIKTKIEIFMEGKGTLIETSKESIGMVDKMEIIVIKSKKLITGEKLSGLTLGVVMIDADEIDGLVQALNVMKDAVSSSRTSPTEIIYKCKTGLAICAGFKLSQGFGSSGWTYYMKPPGNKAFSNLSMSQAEFLSLCSYMEIAKKKM